MMSLMPTSSLLLDIKLAGQNEEEGHVSKTMNPVWLIFMIDCQIDSYCFVGFASSVN